MSRMGTQYDSTLYKLLYNDVLIIHNTAIYNALPVRYITHNTGNIRVNSNEVDE